MRWAALIYPYITFKVALDATNAIQKAFIFGGVEVKIV